MTNVYVISIKRIKDYSNNILSKKDQYYEYLGVDYRSGYDCFMRSDIHCKTFLCTEDANNYFDEVKKNLRKIINFDCYDFSTLGIRKRITTYKTECRLEILKG